jgi:hypothetical protein
MTGLKALKQSCASRSGECQANQALVLLTKMVNHYVAQVTLTLPLL